MNIAAIDTCLTTQLHLTNAALAYDTPQGLLEARTALAVAIGVLSVISEDSAHMAHVYQRELTEATTADELYQLQGSIFSTAFSFVNALQR